MLKTDVASVRHGRRSNRPRATALMILIVVAAALLASQASAATAQPRIHIKKAWCVAGAGTCRQVRPGGTIALGGSGFDAQSIVVFTVRHSGYLENKLSNTSYVGPAHLRAHVPLNVISGPIYVMSATGTSSNTVELPVPSRPSTCPSSPGPGDAVTRWTPVVSCVLALMNQAQTPASINAVLLVVAHESSGNPSAINRWDINAQNGDPSRGLMQIIGANFEAYRNPTLPDNIYDPAANIWAGIAYAISRYGSLANIPGVKSAAAGGPYVPYKQASPGSTG